MMPFPFFSTPRVVFLASPTINTPCLTHFSLLQAIRTLPPLSLYKLILTICQQNEKVPIKFYSNGYKSQCLFKNKILLPTNKNMQGYL